MDLAHFWRGRRVFLTGHTGFKGAWLSLWLEKLGADVSAVALTSETSRALYDRLAPRPTARHRTQDIRDLTELRAIVGEAAPEIVIHMAAQALVRPSYDDPVATFETNVMGTVNVLEAARACSSIKTVLVVTSDKVYANTGSGEPFAEGDKLGGADPYSASKACAELVCESYRASFLEKHGVRLATARAGNVIGGGDWATDRLIPDFMRALERGKPIALRYPSAIRPWQHVLEPLSGYLMYAQALTEQTASALPSALNFGPEETSVATVADVADALGTASEAAPSWVQAPGSHPGEAAILKLDSALASRRLGWHPRLTLREALDWTATWYSEDRNGADMRAVSLSQIAAYEERMVSPTASLMVPA